MNVVFCCVVLCRVVLYLIIQGVVFWDRTRVSLSQQNLPASWRRIADEHSRLASNMLWLFPKVLHIGEIHTHINLYLYSLCCVIEYVNILYAINSI